MRRLFVVDYRENGVARHQCIELRGHAIVTDVAVITACHAHVGMENDLDGVIEIYADMSAHELEEIALTPKILFLPSRNLYINVEEVKRCSQILREA